MSLQLDMKEIERKIYLYYHEDGLLDFVLGLIFLGWGLILAYGPPFLIILLGPIAMMLFYFGKHDITMSRVGIIKPGMRMARRMRNLILALLAIGVLAFIGILLAGLGSYSEIGDYSLSIVGLIVAIGICVLGYLVHAGRFYAYAGLLFVAFAAGEALADQITSIDPFLSAVSLAGAIVLISGLVQIARFLRRYPVPGEGR